MSANEALSKTVTSCISEETHKLTNQEDSENSAVSFFRDLFSQLNKVIDCQQTNR
jgi:hypothetical protein